MEKPFAIKMVEAIIRKEKFPDIDNALKEIGISGLTFFDVEGRGRAKGMEMVSGRGAATYTPEYVERAKVEILVKDSDVKKVVAAISNAAAKLQGQQRRAQGRLLVKPAFSFGIWRF